MIITLSKSTDEICDLILVLHNDIEYERRFRGGHNLNPTVVLELLHLLRPKSDDSRLVIYKSTSPHPPTSSFP